MVNHEFEARAIPVPVSIDVAGPLDVLLVEDDAGDALLVSEAMDDIGDIVRLHVLRDGGAALDFLRRKGEHAAAPRPGLVLLDLNLPGLDGRQVLAEIKTDQDLCTIPVVVLTSSQAETDLLSSYQVHANAYISKPLEAEAFAAVVRGTGTFFATVVKRSH